jgi:putative chitinase
MFTFTKEQLAKLLPTAKGGAEVWHKEMMDLFPVFEIDNKKRVAGFIAQTGHESGGYTVFKENLNYSAQGLMKTWPKRFPTQAVANEFARQPAKIANSVYANRLGNGSPESGDGAKFVGRGLIQLTGKTNYQRFADYAGLTLDQVVVYMETPRGALHSACWYWKEANLNPLADAGDITGMSKRVNGGTIGLDDRINRYNEALKVFA